MFTQATFEKQYPSATLVLQFARNEVELYARKNGRMGNPINFRDFGLEEEFENALVSAFKTGNSLLLGQISDCIAISQINKTIFQ